VTGSWKVKARKIDYLGSLLILAGSISLLIPISWCAALHSAQIQGIDY
jgi:hypothetical protein